MTNNHKRRYEAMFLVDSALAAAQWDDVLGGINKIMERAGAEVISMNKWDERRLAYEISRCRRGTYILCYFKSQPESISGIERDTQLNESILRVQILKPSM